MKNALLIVDMQKDFMPGGSLAVSGADTIIPSINQLMNLFSFIVATKDFHPVGHVSFASSHKGKKVLDEITVEGKKQILWPDHCVQGTEGSNIDPRLDSTKIHHFVHKGVNKDIDSYSTFFDNAHNLSTGLGEYLKQSGVTNVFICGVATDYCVLFSALDALELGFSVYVVTDACKAVDLSSADDQNALKTMKDKGAVLITTKDVPEYL